MGFTYDLDTAVGKVRLLIPDRSHADAFFSDEEISAFLSMEEQETFLAAALALDTLADDEVLVLKAIETMGLKLDGPAVAEALRKRAEGLRTRYYDKASEYDNSIEFASMAVSPSAAWDVLIKDVLG